MDYLPRPKGRYQLIFVLMAGLLICSLFVGIFGSVVLDAFGGDDNGSGGNSTEVDASVEEAFRSTAEANPEDPVAAAALANYLANTGNLSDAIPYYEKAVLLAPDDANLRLRFRPIAGHRRYERRRRAAIPEGDRAGSDQCRGVLLFG